MFFKTTDDLSRRVNSKSYGLGLIICKRIALRLGGDLIFDESYVGGARFILSIHLNRDQTYKVLKFNKRGLVFKIIFYCVEDGRSFLRLGQCLG